MTKKGKLIFLIVVVTLTLLLKHGFQISEITPMDVLFTTLGGVLAVVIISFLQSRENKKIETTDSLVAQFLHWLLQ